MIRTLGKNRIVPQPKVGAESGQVAGHDPESDKFIKLAGGLVGILFIGLIVQGLSK